MDDPQKAETVTVTPAMEHAGLEALWGFDLQDNDPTEIVREIYQAMELARRGIVRDALADAEALQTLLAKLR